MTKLDQHASRRARSALREGRYRSVRAAPLQRTRPSAGVQCLFETSLCRILCKHTRGKEAAESMNTDGGRCVWE
jgi:hypothetical protein